MRNARGYAIRLCAALAVIGAAGCGSASEELDAFATEAAAQAPPDAPAPAAGRVTFGRDMSERIYGVRIRDGAHVKPRVVYSVRLQDVGGGEQLRLRGEVTLSRCNAKDIAGQSGDSKTTPCDSHAMQKDPYSYSPRFSATFVLGNSPSDADGARLAPWAETVCTQGQHHCALAIPQASVQNLANAAEKFVNLVVAADAHGNNAREWHVMEVEKNHGSLSVTRLGAGAGGPVLEEKSSQLLSAGGMTVDRPKEDGDPTQVRQLLYQVKLQGLEGGDVVDADAKMRAVNGGYRCDPLVTTEILVTRDKDERDAKGNFDEILTAKNGSNCPDHSNDGCGYKKSGAVRLKNGAPSVMWVSFIAVALRSCADPGGQDKWHARGSDGFLDVAVRR